MVALVRRHRRQLLADDDGGGDFGDRRARDGSAIWCWRSSSLADLVVLVLFSLAMQFARVASWPRLAPSDVNVLVRLAWEIGGAVAFGCLVGALFALVSALCRAGR